VSVERDEKDKVSVLAVVVEEGGWQVRFIFDDKGRARKTSVAYFGASRHYLQETLRVPAAIYNELLKRALVIYRDGEKRKRKRGGR